MGIHWAPGEVPRGRALTHNATRGGATYAKPAYMGYRRKGNKRPGRESLKFRILFVIHPFYRSVAPRGPPGDVPREADINAQHQTRGRYIQETAVDGVRKKGKHKTAQCIPGNPDSSRKSAILPFRSVPCGGPGGAPREWTLTFNDKRNCRILRPAAFSRPPGNIPRGATISHNAQRRDSKYTEPPYRAATHKGKQEDRAAAPKIPVF